MLKHILSCDNISTRPHAKENESCDPPVGYFNPIKEDLLVTQSSSSQCMPYNILNNFYTWISSLLLKFRAIILDSAHYSFFYSQKTLIGETNKLFNSISSRSTCGNSWHHLNLNPSQFSYLIGKRLLLPMTLAWKRISQLNGRFIMMYTNWRDD